MAANGVSERRTVRVSGSAKSAYRHRSIRDPQTALRMRLKALSAARVRYGNRRLYVLLPREGWSTNHKRSDRLYCEEGLSIRTKRPADANIAGIGWGDRQLVVPTTPGRWTSSPSGCSTDGRFESWRCSTAIREKLSRHVRGQSSGRTRQSKNWIGSHGAAASREAFGSTTAPSSLVRCSTSGRLRAECLNVISMSDARQRIDEWRIDCNTKRPHIALGGLTPKAFADRIDRALKIAWRMDPSSGQDQSSAARTARRYRDMGSDIGAPYQARCAGLHIAISSSP